MRDFECPFGRAWGELTPPPDPKQVERDQTEWWSKTGPAMWEELHRKRDVDQAWLDGFTNRIPCGSCAQHWRELLAELPPVFGEGFFEWSWRVHNAVNAKLGKPGLTLDEARAMYTEPPPFPSPPPPQPPQQTGAAPSRGSRRGSRRA